MIGEVQLVAISCEFVGLTVISPAVVKSAEDGEGFTAVLQSKAGFGIEIIIKDLVLWRDQGRSREVRVLSMSTYLQLARCA